MKTAVIYARYSSDNQTEQSIEGQLHVCQDYAKRNDITIVDTYIDRAMSGTNDKRTDFQRLLRDSNKQAWDYVLVYKLDRFSRNKYEMAIHKKTLKDNGIKLISAMENIPDTPEGIILESLLEGMAEYYSAELSQKVKRGMNETRKKGNFTGGTILYGYKVENKKIVINEEEAQVVKNLFVDYASGKLVMDILAELRQNGVLYRGKRFGRNNLYYFLRNEKYNGKYTFNGEIYTNMYPKIIPDELFETVRNKIENNKYGKHKPDIVYLLKNKLKCGYCGNIVNSDAGTSRNGNVKRYYKCRTKKTHKDCPLNPVRKELIEDFVVKTILSALGNNAILIEIANKIVKITEERIANDSTLSLLYKEMEKIDKAISNVLSAIDNGIITTSTKQHLEDLELKKNELAEQIALQNSKEKIRLTKDDIIKYMKTAITKSPKQMIDLLVKEIKLYNDKVEIFFKYNKKVEDTNLGQDVVYSERQDAKLSKTNQKIHMDINCII